MKPTWKYYNVLKIKCPECGAEIGQRCYSTPQNKHRVTIAHKSRWEKAPTTLSQNAHSSHVEAPPRPRKAPKVPKGHPPGWKSYNCTHSKHWECPSQKCECSCHPRPWVLDKK